MVTGDQVNWTLDFLPPGTVAKGEVPLYTCRCTRGNHGGVKMTNQKKPL